MSDTSDGPGDELLPAHEGVSIMRTVARLVASGEQALERAASPVAKAKIRESLQADHERLGVYSTRSSDGESTS